MKNRIISQMKKAGVAVSMAAVFCLAIPQTDFAATSAYVDVRSANVRQKPVDGENITSLPQGTYVSVQETQQGSDGQSWSKIQFTNQGKQIMGWVRSDLIIDAKNADQEAQEETPVNAVKLEDTAQTDSPLGAETSSATDADSSQAQEETDADSADSEAENKIQNGSLTLAISENFTAEEVPVDFSKGEVKYKGKTYQGVTYNNGELNALYLVDEQTSIGSFYICDEKNDTIYPFVRVTYGDGYLIFLQNQDSNELPTGSTATILPLENGTQLEAFWYLGNQESSDFYEVYAMNEEGTCSWYSYDNVDKTCQRLNIQDNSEQLNNLNKAYNKLKEKNEQQRKSDHKIMAGMIIGCVLLFFLLINVLLRRPAKKKESTRAYKEKKTEKKKQPKKMSESDNKAVAEAVASAVQSIQNDTMEQEKIVSAETDEQARDHYMEVLEKVSKTAETQPQAEFAAPQEAAKDNKKTVSKKKAASPKTKQQETVKKTIAAEAAERTEKTVQEQREDFEKVNKNEDLEILDLNDL
ncbi:MAG: SH3 domain-containing protein [Lachnospiraceae bacterium]